MGKEDHIILAVHVTDRVTHAPAVQEALTEFGCNIKTRIGLHEVDDAACSPNGLILLECAGDPARCDELEGNLAAIEGVEVKKVVFRHD
jgi:hypothetical protein